MVGNFTRAGIFLLNAACWLYTVAILLRFLLQLMRADFYNPLSQAVVKVTNPLLRPLRKVIPGWQGIDVAAIVLMLLVQVAYIALIMLMIGSWPAPMELLVWTPLRLISITLNFYFFSILIQVLLSWVSPGGYNPVAAALWSINEPLLRPARRLIPPIGMLDISPMVVLLLLQAVNIILPLPNLLR